MSVKLEMECLPRGYRQGRIPEAEDTVEKKNGGDNEKAERQQKRRTFHRGGAPGQSGTVHFV